MTRKEQQDIEDADLAKVEPALRRAAKRARKIAQQTGTPIVTYENGRVIRKTVTEPDTENTGSQTD